MNHYVDIDLKEILATPINLSPVFESNNNIIIYGAGNMGKYILDILNSHGIKVEAFLDRKATKDKSQHGIPIYLPEWNGLSAKKRKQTTVIAALHNRDAKIPAVLNLLRKQGYIKIINLIEFTDYFSEEMENQFWLASRKSYKSWEKEIVECNSMWADETSRQNYKKLLKFRLTGDYDLTPVPEPTLQYFPSDLPRWNTRLRFVDGGAYNGDTLRSLLNSNYEIESIAAFEPDPENFRALNKYVISKLKSRALLWPCGIYSSTKLLTFSGSGEGSSHLSKGGNITIQTVALDDVIPSFQPNLIKFDIEGAEYEGLLGAKRIIESNRPGLAICLYHNPEHLWSIPLLINSWKLGYKLYMRVYKQNGFETVMYAKPDKIKGRRS